MQKSGTQKIHLEQYSLEEIPRLTKKVFLSLSGGEIFGLVGPLGSGKTFFTKNLGKLLKIKPVIKSPTFSLMHSYHGRLKNGKKITLLHLDTYRLKSKSEFLNLGVNEIWGTPNTVTVVEWANKFKTCFPKKTKFLIFKHNEIF